MKRETMEWLEYEAEAKPNRNKARELIAELKRLRRIERAARKAVSMQTAEGLDAALGELAKVASS